MLTNVFQQKLDEIFALQLGQDVSLIASQEETIEFIHPNKNFLYSLCDRVTYLFSIDPVVLELTSPIVTVGDLHGHYLDLIRIIQACGHPSNTKYIFLGDIVDRGEFSFETILLIFLMKACYPLNIFLIRGNHEFDGLCSKYGFFNEIHLEYCDKRIYYAFTNVFAQIPIAAIIDHVTICVHGGIGPELSDINKLKNVNRPIENFNQNLTGPLFWSDPSPTVTDFKPSPRGTGYLFGHNALLDFLEASQAVRIVRGHECIKEGYSTLFEERVVTIFSASNYCGTLNNESAILLMSPDGEDEVKRFPPLPYLKRCYANFRKEQEIKNEYKNVGPSFSTGSVLLKSVINMQPSKNGERINNQSNLFSGNFNNVINSTNFHNGSICAFPGMNAPSVSPALHRLQQLNQRQTKMNQSTSFTSQKWTEFKV
ncbi:Ser/Thr protein phosphatase [Tritrichomonas foetus]|uniref:Serine/threonine-protein phosphatase n=1 Tax=Tritrichomonas foetus TaxID=1144522 RepID=A0A1J4JB62_9EUKA|nr:Ser/Thr protein phosphatase [Tritrichomonas foetus]|eukprot:OHS94669.1 Ser/Thr protein phosphatase [Tritrichomonas foetus]